MSESSLPMQVTLPCRDWVRVEAEPATDESPAFVALRRNLAHDVVPTIRLTGGRRDDAATLGQIADGLVAAAAEEAASVKVLDRHEVGGEHVPGLTQALAIVGARESQGFELRRSQVLLAMLDVHDPTKRVVVVAELVCAADQFAEMAQEFQSFVANIRLDRTGES